jgi:DnaJ family protein C protein 16
LDTEVKLSVTVKMRGSKTNWAFLLLTIIVAENILGVYSVSFEPYRVLDVHRRASLSDIRKAYKKLVKEWHPDKVAGDQGKKEAEGKFIEINRAYELLRLVSEKSIR